MSHSLLYPTSHPMPGGVGYPAATNFGNFPCDPFVQAWPPLAPGVDRDHLLSVTAAALGQALHGLVAPLLNATRFQASPWLPQIVQFAAPPGMPGMPQSYVPYPSQAPYQAPYPPQHYPPQQYAPQQYGPQRYQPHYQPQQYPPSHGQGAPQAAYPMSARPPMHPAQSPAHLPAHAAARREPAPSFTPTPLDPQAFLASATELLASDVSDMVLAHPAPGQPEPAFFAGLKHAGQSVVAELPLTDGTTARAEGIRLEGEAADGSWLLALNVEMPGEPPEHRLIRMHDVKTRPEDGAAFLADLERIEASLQRSRCGEEGRTLGVMCHDGASESGAVIAGLNALGEAEEMRRESRESGQPMPPASQFVRTQREFMQDARDTRGPSYAQGQDRQLDELTRLIYEAVQTPDEPATPHEPAILDQPVPDDVQRQPLLQPRTDTAAPMSAPAADVPTTTPKTTPPAAAPTTTASAPPQAPAAQQAPKGADELSDQELLQALARLPSPPTTQTPRHLTRDLARQRRELENVNRMREEIQLKQLDRLASAPKGLPRSASAPDLRTAAATLDRTLAMARAASEPAISTRERAQPLTGALGDLFALAARHGDVSQKKDIARANDELGVFGAQVIDRMAPMIDSLRTRYDQKPDGRGEQLYIAETLAKAARRAFQELPAASQARIAESWGRESSAFGSARAILDVQTKRMAELSDPKSTQGLETLPAQFDRLARRQGALSYTLAAMEFALSSANESQA